MSDNGWITLPVDDLVRMGQKWEDRCSKLRAAIDQKNTEIHRLREELARLEAERDRVTV